MKNRKESMTREDLIRCRGKIKLAALDLDRTTLNAKGELSERTKRGIQKAIQEGIRVVIASGRAVDTLPAEVLSIPGIEYAVTSNGAAVYQLPGSTAIRHILIPQEDICMLIREMKEYHPVYEAFIDGKAYAYDRYVADPVRFGATKSGEAYIKRTRRPIADMEAFLYEHREELESVDLVISSEKEMTEIRIRLAEVLPDVYQTSSIKGLLELSGKLCGKEKALAFLCERLNILPEETIAFGDADNDVDMLLFSGIGIAVENACEACRQAADYITGHHDLDGVAQVLELIAGTAEAAGSIEDPDIAEE